jgi:uncharacterized protein (DUF1330 family)
MSNQRVVIVATLTVRVVELDAFREFERHAANVMARHGGAIERSVFARVEGAPELAREIHFVTFPSEAAFARYRADPELAARAALRDRSVVSSELVIGVDGPDYGPG